MNSILGTTPFRISRANCGSGFAATTTDSTGVSVLPTPCARSAPGLWHHFAPNRPLDVDLPLASVRVVDDALTFTDSPCPPHELLGLSADWPGPDARF